MTAITTVPTTDLADLVDGPVFVPADPDYTAEVAGFNAAHRPTPAVVVGATSAEDISTAIRWAHQRGLRVVAQATGHGLVDDRAGTLMITTHRLDNVVVDPAMPSATVGAGVRWRAVVEAAAPHGLAPLSGSASGVGVVGYTLGGGMGLLARQYGYAADHVRSLTVVTADGQIRTVDAGHDAELFWALRGGKIGLGIVAEIEFDLFPVRTLYAGGLFFPGAAAAEVLHAWSRWAPTMPETVTTSVSLLRLPPDPHLPPPLMGQFVVHLRFASTDAVTAAALLEPMRAVAPVLMDTVDPALPYVAADAVHMDPPVPMPAFDRGLTLGELDADTVDTVLAGAGPDSGSALTLVELRLMGGALSRPAEVPNAVAGRNAQYGVYILGVPAGPFAGLVPAQVDGLVDALRPWRVGALPNFVGHAAPGDWQGIWSPADRERLMATTVAYDPDDVFGGRRQLG